jgi:hypothetical protein
MPFNSIVLEVSAGPKRKIVKKIHKPWSREENDVVSIVCVFWLIIYTGINLENINFSHKWPEIRILLEQ